MNELQIAVIAMFVFGAIAGPLALTLLAIVGASYTFTERYKVKQRRAYITILPEFVYKEVDWRLVAGYYPKAAVFGTLVVGNLTVYAIGLHAVIA